VPEEADLILSETAILDTPLVLLDSLLFVLSPMLERIMRSAVERAYALRSLTLALQLEKAPAYERHIRPAIATQSRDLLLKLLNLDLQTHPPQAAILGVTLTAEASRPQTAQRGLFQAQFPEPAGQSHTKVACTFLVTFVWVVFRRMVAGGFLDVPQRDIGSVFRVLGGSGRPA
jgi:protein ImuB